MIDVKQKAQDELNKMTKQKLQTKTAISSNGMLAEVKPSAWVDIKKELPATGSDDPAATALRPR